MLQHETIWVYILLYGDVFMEGGRSYYQDDPNAICFLYSVINAQGCICY